MNPDHPLDPASHRAWLAFEIAVLGILFVYTLSHLVPTELLMDTMTVGGDTPAHNYLASHLKQQLFIRVVSQTGRRAGGPGFPHSSSTSSCRT